MSNISSFRNEEVFISYSSKDEAIAKKIKALLESPPRSVTCWMANDITISGGEDFRNMIVDALRRCKVFLFILSKSSMNSNWCPLELSWAIMENKKIYTIRIDDEPLSDEFSFKLGCSQISDGTVNFDAVVESLAINVKNGRDEVLESEKAGIANSKHYNSFALRCLIAFSHFMGLQWIVSLILSIVIANRNGGLRSIMSSSLDSMEKLVFVNCLGTLIALIPLFLVINGIVSLRMKRLTAAANMNSPSALYCLYKVHYYHHPFLWYWARKKALEHLHRSAELGYVPALKALEKRSKKEQDGY